MVQIIEIKVKVTGVNFWYQDQELLEGLKLSEPAVQNGLTNNRKEQTYDSFSVIFVRCADDGCLVSHISKV